MRSKSQNIIPCQQYGQFHATSFMHIDLKQCFSNHNYPVRSMPGRVMCLVLQQKSLFILSVYDDLGAAWAGQGAVRTGYICIVI